MNYSQSEKSQKGFSIVEVLMTMVIFGVISSAIATSMLHQSNMSKYLDDKASYRDLKIELERLLSDSAICFESFNAVVMPSAINENRAVNRVSINDLNSTQSFARDSLYDGLKIDNFRIKNLDIAPASTSGFSELEVQVSRNKNSQVMKSLKLKLQVVLNPANRRIDSCSLVSDGSGDVDKACVVPVLRSSQRTFSGYSGSSGTRSYASTFTSGFEIIKDGSEVSTYETQAHGPYDCNKKMAWSVYSKKLKCINKVATEHSRLQLASFNTTIVREDGDDSGCGL